MWEWYTLHHSTGLVYMHAYTQYAQSYLIQQICLSEKSKCWYLLHMILDGGTLEKEVN